MSDSIMLEMAFSMSMSMSMKYLYSANSLRSNLRRWNSKKVRVSRSQNSRWFSGRPMTIVRRDKDRDAQLDGVGERWRGSQRQTDRQTEIHQCYDSTQSNTNLYSTVLCYSGPHTDRHADTFSLAY